MAFSEVEAATETGWDVASGEFEKEGCQASAPGLNAQARRLVEKHIGLVGLHLKRRVPTPGHPRRDREYRDLFQEGCLALCRAAVEYDPERHGPFASYAILRVRRGVYEALHDQFTLMRIPGRRHLDADSDAPTQAETIAQIPRGTTLTARPYISGCAETLRHRLHERYERALRAALRELKSRPWRNRDPVPILERLVAERLLITQECMRTPLRQIARESSISSGRAAGYERHLVEVATQCLRADPQLPVLLRWMKDNGYGFDAALDEELLDELDRAEDQAFHTHFINLSKPERAALIYDLLDRSQVVIDEIARNLHRLVRNSEIDTCSGSLCA